MQGREQTARLNRERKAEKTARLNTGNAGPGAIRQRYRPDGSTVRYVLRTDGSLLQGVERPGEKRFRHRVVATSTTAKAMVEEADRELRQAGEPAVPAVDSPQRERR